MRTREREREILLLVVQIFKAVKIIKGGLLEFPAMVNVPSIINHFFVECFPPQNLPRAKMIINS